MWIKVKLLAFVVMLLNSVALANDNVRNFSLDEDECIILVASTKSEAEAQAIAKKYQGSELYTSKSGYIAVGLEKISKQRSTARIKDLLATGRIPKGSNCADGKRITGLLDLDATKSHAKSSHMKKNPEENKLEVSSVDKLSEKLAQKVGPEGAFACSLLSIRAMGAFSRMPKGSDGEAMFYGFTRMFEIYTGIAKLLNVRESDTFFQSRANWAKAVSQNEMARYLETNCNHPEVFELAKQGFK